MTSYAELNRTELLSSSSKNDQGSSCSDEVGSERASQPACLPPSAQEPKAKIVATPSHRLDVCSFVRSFVSSMCVGFALPQNNDCFVVLSNSTFKLSRNQTTKTPPLPSTSTHQKTRPCIARPSGRYLWSGLSLSLFLGLRLSDRPSSTRLHSPPLVGHPPSAIGHRRSYCHLPSAIVHGTYYIRYRQII
ncbi:hypothetical protein Mapa_004339 [Marchantia paleacea]|nr:hypothetical protein Mapa_004339 [Marchantia paleacea]